MNGNGVLNAQTLCAAMDTVLSGSEEQRYGGLSIMAAGTGCQVTPLPGSSRGGVETALLVLQAATQHFRGSRRTVRLRIRCWQRGIRTHYFGTANEARKWLTDERGRECVGQSGMEWLLLVSRV